MLTGGPGKTSMRAGWGKFYSTFEGATNFNEIGDAPFGAFYGSPGASAIRYPVCGSRHRQHRRPALSSALTDHEHVINWANFLPIGTSPAFWHKNVLPYTEEYQLSFQRQLGSSTLLTAGYVGTQGHHLMSSLEANPGNPALCLSVSQPSQTVDGVTCGPNGENGVYLPITGGTINSTRGPFGGSFSSDGYFITNGKSSYNSLQLSVRQRISRLEFLAGYTYSKSLDNGSGYGEQINPLNQGLRSLSSFDVRHNFVVSYDYQLPFDRFGGPSRLVRGWRLSGITRFSTGLPVTLIETDDNSLLGTSSAGAISLPVDTPNFTSRFTQYRRSPFGAAILQHLPVQSRDPGDIGNRAAPILLRAWFEQLGYRASQRHSDQGRNESGVSHRTLQRFQPCPVPSARW